MMDNKPQALPCLQITGLAAQIAEKYGLRPVPYSALRRVYDTRFPLPVQTRRPQRANVGRQVLHRVAAGQRAGALWATLPGGISLRN